MIESRRDLRTIGVLNFAEVLELMFEPPELLRG